MKDQNVIVSCYVEDTVPILPDVSSGDLDQVGKILSYKSYKVKSRFHRVIGRHQIVNEIQILFTVGNT